MSDIFIVSTLIPDKFVVNNKIKRRVTKISFSCIFSFSVLKKQLPNLVGKFSLLVGKFSPTGYNRNGFVATLGHMMYSYILLDYHMYIFIYIYICIYIL